MVKLIIYMEKAHTYKKEKYLDLTKELDEAGYRADNASKNWCQRGCGVISRLSYEQTLNQRQQTNQSLETTIQNKRKQFLLVLDLEQDK
ncbi:hypothetical protein ElyMa_000008400 [Elysia marginata]|uniref:Uncharacterized protein n=1 Tax=Elysia marginata TaxID=1093978 RepID=A0AAV4EAN8_9GAST|nr:hypothetical protein ElyMa_000008400 [Elysia marginata]